MIHFRSKPHRFATMETITRKHWTSLHRRAAAGDPDAQWEVGFYYEFGAKNKVGKVLAAVEPVTAVKCYQVAAEQGNCRAQDALGSILSTGDKVTRDFTKAIYWAKKAVAQGDASATYNLATIYRDLGKPKLAFHWYQKAAALGDAGAYLQVGLSYLFGLGVNQNLAFASQALHRILASDPNDSSQREKENARYWIAVIRLINGPRTKASIAKSRAMLEVANADEDHEQANELLNLIGKRRYLKDA